MTVQSKGFSIGFAFIYWDQYRTQNWEQLSYNHDDHGWHSVADMISMQPKYGSLKEEIISN